MAAISPLIAEAAVESLHKNRPVKIDYWQPTT
jgi:hypothetical protein